SRNYRAMPTIDVIEEEKELYLAISPKGDFVVEFVLLENEEFEFRMFKVIKKLNNNDYSDQNYDDSCSSKKLTLIKHCRKQLNFTKDQSNLIASKNNIL
ncbi:5993_t:CDS:2, partial [Gigaspora rosea]